MDIELDKRLGQIAVAKGILTNEQIEECLRIQQSTTPHKPLGAIMLQLGFILDEDLDTLLAAQIEIKSKEIGRVADEEDITEKEERKGKPFGNYLLLEELEKGTTGQLYEALDKNTNSTVALKIVIPPPGVPPEEAKQLHMAAGRAAKLIHPNIVPVLEVGSVRDTLYFTMEYVEGRSLATYAAEGKLQVKKTLELTKQVADALQYAHGQNVLHGALKPQNILIDIRGQARLTDFGMRWQTMPEAKLPGGKLNFAFLPPELFAGKIRELFPQGDVYSLGAILYYTLTRRLPFDGRTPQEIIKNVLSASAVLPTRISPAIPPPAEAICLKAMERNLKKRYPSAGAMALDIVSCIEGKPTSARRLGFLRKLLRRS